MKEFYVHAFRQGKLSNASPRGFTLKISPINGDERNVRLQAALCSPKDQFCKKTGRQVAEGTEGMDLNKRQVPSLLAGLSQVCALERSTDRSTWYYLYKYLL